MGSDALVACALCAKRIATTEPAPPESAPARGRAAARRRRAVLALQRTAGNAAVVAMLQREPVAEAEQPLANLDPAPGWRAEVELLQQKLNWHRGSSARHSCSRRRQVRQQDERAR